MPYDTRWEPTGVCWVYRGTVTDDEVIRSNHEVYDDARMARIRYEIVDFRRVERFAVSPETIREISRTDASLSSTHPQIRVAMVADTDLTRGIATMYRLACGECEWEVELFDTVEAARAWIRDRKPRAPDAT